MHPTQWDSQMKRTCYKDCNLIHTQMPLYAKLSPSIHGKIQIAMVCRTPLVIPCSDKLINKGAAL